MNEITELSPAVSEKLGYYVYFLIDPETEKPFYVGKGRGNRVLNHINHAISSPLVSDKLEKIRTIQEKGLPVKHIIHRHGLNEKEAFEVEASLIDFIGLAGLSNIVNGRYSNYRGHMTVAEVISQYDAPNINIIEPVILLTINSMFRRDMTEVELYEITRGNWVVGERRNKAKYAFSVTSGIVREVYEIQQWYPAKARSEESKIQNRWNFEGVIAHDLEHYVGGCVDKYVGFQNPVRYVNC